MKRRQFLAVPAAGLLLPELAGRATLFAAHNRSEPPAIDTRFQQRLHQDFSTYIPGVEYFPMGNGEIIAIVQYAPDRTGERPATFYGFTLMDAERFARKWSTFLFHPERGFERTAANIVIDGHGYTPVPENFTRILWTHVDQVPVVGVEWRAGSCFVHEELSVPHRGQLFFRTITLSNEGATDITPTIQLSLVPNFTLFDEISVDQKKKTAVAGGFASMKLLCLDGDVTVSGRYDLASATGKIAPGEKRSIRFVYALGDAEQGISSSTFERARRATISYWKAKHNVSSGDPLIDALYGIARPCLKALVARSGKRDSGIWMYNMEWVRDDIMVAGGMLQAGFTGEARTILTKVLEKSIGEDGRTIESSRWFGYDYTELDQNGQLLFGVWQYASWTGDRPFLKKYWEKIRRAGDFPLQPVFLDAKAGLLRNKREFWERSDSFGVQDGFELAYQFWVTLGLEKGAEVAAWVGDHTTAARWGKAAAELKDHMLNDPVFKLIENGHFIKRRTRAGAWQRVMKPPHPESMPPNSPMATLTEPVCEPDTASVYPIMFEMVDPRGELSRATLADMEVLWNQKWEHGGYSRYNTDSEPDPPAPWPFASLFMARAYTEAGDAPHVWRILRWLRGINGGQSGGWFERYGPSITPPAPPVCIVGWTHAEIITLVTHHILGFRPGLAQLVIRPRLLDGMQGMSGTFVVHGAHVSVTVSRTTALASATVDGMTVTMENGAVKLPIPKRGKTTEVHINVV